MMQGRHGVSLHLCWSRQSSESNVGSTELVMLRVLGMSMMICGTPLQTIDVVHVLVVGRQAARVVAQVRVVDVQHHPLDVPAVATVNGHCLGLLVLGPGGRLRGCRGGILLVLLLLPSRGRPVAELHGVARPGDGTRPARGSMMRSLWLWLVLLVAVVVPRGSGAAGTSTAGMAGIAVWCQGVRMLMLVLGMARVEVQGVRVLAIAMVVMDMDMVAVVEVGVDVAVGG